MKKRVKEKERKYSGGETLSGHAQEDFGRENAGQSHMGSTD